MRPSSTVPFLVDAPTSITGRERQTWVSRQLGIGMDATFARGKSEETELEVGRATSSLRLCRSRLGKEDARNEGGPPMCLSCGCGEPNESHGNPDNITQDMLQKAADAAEVSVAEAAANISSGAQA
jgi:hypothetical protein